MPSERGGNFGEDQFIGARLKIKRANQHINELNSILERLRQSDFYSLKVDKNIKTRRNRITLRFKQQIPQNVSLITGDAIHNLRSALDHTIYEAIVIAGGKPNKFTRFPFNKTEEELKGAVKGGLAKITSKEVCDLIISDIKPYPGGNDLLYDLHQLDIIDKHRLITTVLQVVSVSGVCVEGHKGFRLKNATLMVVGNGELRAVETDEDIKITNKGNASFNIVFGQGLPMKSNAVIPALTKLSGLISGIVDQFQELACTPLKNMSVPDASS